MPRLLSLVVAFLPALAACDKKPPPAPAPAAPDKPAAPAAPSDAACKLLTKDDAARFLGRAVGAGAVGPNLTEAACTYTADNPAGSVKILLYASGADAMNDNLKAHLMGAEPIQMPGIGTRAYRTDNGASFGVLAKGKFAYVVAVSDSGGPTPDAAQKLADSLASRM